MPGQPPRSRRVRGQCGTSPRKRSRQKPQHLPRPRPRPRRRPRRRPPPRPRTSSPALPPRTIRSSSSTRAASLSRKDSLSSPSASPRAVARWSFRPATLSPCAPAPKRAPLRNRSSTAEKAPGPSGSPPAEAGCRTPAGGVPQTTALQLLPAGAALQPPGAAGPAPAPRDAGGRGGGGSQAVRIAHRTLKRTQEALRESFVPHTGGPGRMRCG